MKGGKMSRVFQHLGLGCCLKHVIRVLPHILSSHQKENFVTLSASASVLRQSSKLRTSPQDISSSCHVRLSHLWHDCSFHWSESMSLVLLSLHHIDTAIAAAGRLPRYRILDGRPFDFSPHCNHNIRNSSNEMWWSVSCPPTLRGV